MSRKQGSENSRRKRSKDSEKVEYKELSETPSDTPRCNKANEFEREDYSINIEDDGCYDCRNCNERSEYRKCSGKTDKCKHDCCEVCCKYKGDNCDFVCDSHRELLIRIICLLIDKEYGLKAIEQKIKSSQQNDAIKNIKSITRLLEEAIVGLGETALGAVKKAVDAAGTMTDITQGLAQIAAGTAGTAGSLAFATLGLTNVAAGTAGTAGATANTVAATTNVAAGAALTASATANAVAATANVVADTALTASAAGNTVAGTANVVAATAGTTAGVTETGSAVTHIAAGTAGTAAGIAETAAGIAGIAAGTAAIAGAAVDTAVVEAGIVAGTAAIAGAAVDTAAEVAGIVAGEAAIAGAATDTAAQVAGIVAGTAGTASALANTAAGVAGAAAGIAGTAANIAATVDALTEIATGTTGPTGPTGSVSEITLEEGGLEEAMPATEAAVSEEGETDIIVAAEDIPEEVASETDADITVNEKETSIEQPDETQGETEIYEIDYEEPHIAAEEPVVNKPSENRSIFSGTAIVTTGPAILDNGADTIQVRVLNNNCTKTDSISVIVYDLADNPKSCFSVQSLEIPANSCNLFTVISAPAVYEVQIKGISRNVFANVVSCNSISGLHCQTNSYRSSDLMQIDLV